MKDEEDNFVQALSTALVAECDPMRKRASLDLRRHTTSRDCFNPAILDELKAACP
jgi:hypothetical protein